MRGVPFDRRVEALLADHNDLAPIARPMLVAWRQLREQIAAYDKEVRALAKKDPTCRLLMSVPGIWVVSVLACVSTIEDPVRFARSRSVGAHGADAATAKKALTRSTRAARRRGASCPPRGEGTGQLRGRPLGRAVSA
jgi:transposase